MKYILVISTVLCTLVSALLLDHIAKSSIYSMLITLVFIAAAIVLNFTKFFLWGRIYRQYPLGTTYPITASFFPIIYLVALVSGQASLQANKAIAILLILLGIYLLSDVRKLS